MNLKSILSATVALGVLTLAPATAQDATPAPGTDLVELYTYLHSNPELSLKEANSSAILAAELEELGFEVTTGVGNAFVEARSMADFDTVRDGVGGYGVVGVMKNGDGPTVMIRADMDGLPVPEQTGLAYASKVTGMTWTGVESPVMHACGHDIHMTSWVGTARELAANKDKWSGTLVMIAQPAEEIGLGAKAMIEDGLFENFPKPDYNLALHVKATAPAGTVSYVPGFSMANVDSVDIKINGVGGHGAYPHTTRDPVVIGSAIVMAVQTLVSRNLDPQKAGVVTVGSFKAGAKHNIIADDATLLLTVRSYDDETRQMLLDGIKRIANAQAEAFDAPPPEITIDPDYTPANYNDPDFSERAMAAIGEAIGADNVLVDSPVMGGEDFSRYGRTDDDIPGLLFWLGAVSQDTWQAAQDSGETLPSLHSSFFAPDAAPAIATGVKSMSAAAIELFNSEDS